MKITKRRAGVRELTDLERILLHIVQGLHFTQVLAGGGPMRWGDEYFRSNVDGDFYTHFAKWHKPAPGDLVYATSGGISQWKVGIYVCAIPGGAQIRMIGTDFLCDYTNEEFVPIRGIHKSNLLEGEQYQFERKVLMAFCKGHEYMYRYGGIEFPTPENAIVYCRAPFGGIPPGSCIPFGMHITWNKRTSVKRILEQMRQQGYGKREYARQEVPA